MGKEGSRKEIYWVISEIQELIKDRYCFEVCHIYIVCNYVAHNLANLALKHGNSVTWLENFPAQIAGLL